jgi:hypothetical protein
MIRRQLDHLGTFTRRAAQEAIDAQAFRGNFELSEKDQQAVALTKFASEVNASTMDNTLPAGGSIASVGSDQWSSAADSVAGAIASRSKWCPGRFQHPR